MDKLLQSIKKFLPFIGITALYFLLILLVVFLFNYYNPTSLALKQGINPFILLVRWDSMHYLDIAMGGQQSLVFFPLYPLLIKFFSLFFSYIFSGFLISFLSLSTALYYLYKLINKNNSHIIASRSLLLLLFFPTAIFFSLIYTESLFLALLSAFFYYAEKKKWLTVAIIGFFAILTRNIGIFLWPIFIIYIFNNLYSFKYRKLLKNIIGLIQKKEFWYSLLIPLGLILYCIYSYTVSGDFLAFINQQQLWSEWHIFLWPGETFYNLFKFYILEPVNATTLYPFLRIIIIEFGSFLILLTATIYWIIKKHWPYAMFCLLNTILFSCIYPMTSVNRYVVVMFPIFIFLSKITKKIDWLFYTILAIFFIFFVFNIHILSIGAWIG